MFYVIVSRGWVTDKDPGDNTSYYLYTNDWYRLMSPGNMNSNGRAYIAHIGAPGRIGDLWDKDGGGVQILELCYFDKIEAG